jgi:alkylhydroperoxidase/carboxymuconolactone decarboxylase family protein YurZ
MIRPSSGPITSESFRARFLTSAKCTEVGAISARPLIALNRPDQLRAHLAIARQNGVMREELIETITHLAFYAGWPNAVTAIGVAREVFGNK